MASDGSPIWKRQPVLIEMRSPGAVVCARTATGVANSRAQIIHSRRPGGRRKTFRIDESLERAAAALSQTNRGTSKSWTLSYWHREKSSQQEQVHEFSMRPDYRHREPVDRH